MAKNKAREVYQLDLLGFDEETKFQIPKNVKVKLCEFFAGVGFTRIGIKRVIPNLISHKIVEWAIPSILAYDSVHNEESVFLDHSCCDNMSKEEIANKLYELGVSNNYDEPSTLNYLLRLSDEKLRQIYSSITHTHNLVNIMNIKGIDLEITDTDNNFYIWTWSFPCQDISGAGQGKGFSESQANNENQSISGNGTRSGLCWEFIRILKELKELGNGMPQLLIMENVPLIHSKENNVDFLRIQQELEKLGYNNKWQDLMGTDYGIPQNRNRTFMVSMYDPSHKYNYAFPHPIKLTKNLQDLLETEPVDEKYYLSDSMIKYIVADNEKWTGNNNESLVNKKIASTINTREGSRRCDASNYICDNFNEEDLDLKEVIENSPKLVGGGIKT